MAVITESNGIHTVIVVFITEPENQAALVENLLAVVADHSQRDGFLSCSIHRSQDGTRVAEYIQWRSRRHWQAMVDSPEGGAHVNDQSFASDAHIYDVVSVTDAKDLKPA